MQDFFLGAEPNAIPSATRLPHQLGANRQRKNLEDIT